jgi:hypothetical protein
LSIDRILATPIAITIALTICIAPVRAIPPNLQTDLTDRNLQTLEKLIAIAQTTAPTIKEAQANLGLAPFNEVIVFNISKGSNSEEGDRFDDENRGSSSLSAEISIDLIRVISAFEGIPARKAQLNNAQRQTRLAVTQAYIAYIQAKQVKAIAKYRLQRFGKAKQNITNTEYLTATTELLTANSNERIAFEILAAAVGRSPQEIRAIELQSIDKP